ncbi:hypothetical protein AB1L88_26415 [Tautonia sp. JC769]|uniref:hypothetical protein n=1 Tax=Tautonia sp. JC769 TaxID=3232135 RepID=UPI00345B48FB
MRFIRFNRCLLAALVLSASIASAATVRADDEPEAQLLNLVLTPRPEPVPALRYRLLPSSAELYPGNAAPVYLRFYAEQNPEAKKQIHEKAVPWLDEPLDAFPVEEAGDFVRMYGNSLLQLAIAARRKECDWAYPLLEQREEAYNILLPDIQELRTASRLLALKARVEIAQGDFDEAVRTIQTGMAMARHLAESPFMISRLVGIAVANQFLDRVEELVSRPDAPNLSWALAALPRPLIDTREGLETEQVVGEWILPELTGLDSVGSEEEWEIRLARLHERLARIDVELRQAPDDQDEGDRVPETLDQFRSEYLPAAREFFAEPGSLATDSNAELIVRFLAERNRRLIDGAFKFSYLSIREALPIFARSRIPDDASIVLMPILPSDSGDEVLALVRHLHLPPARIARRVAALRVVEAIRWHASANEGTLPASLDAIEVIPVPVDPVSGAPFSYRLDGEAAILEAPETALPVPTPGLPYRITLRK